MAVNKALNALDMKLFLVWQVMAYFSIIVNPLSMTHVYINKWLVNACDNRDHKIIYWSNHIWSNQGILEIKDGQIDTLNG